MGGFDVLDRATQIGGATFLQASAGTGKTFAIEHLLMRHLLQPSGPKIDEILVVTFTKAACNDLKKRIFESLEQTLFQLKELVGLPDYLLEIVEQGPKALEKAKKAIQEALIAFDAAKIVTIHGFCYQELIENPLSSDVPLDLKEEHVVEKELEMRVKDFFRTGISSDLLSTSGLDSVLRHYGPDFSSLVKSLVRCVMKRTPIISGLPFSSSFKQFKKELKAIQKGLSSERLLEELKMLAPSYKGFLDRQNQLKPTCEQAFSLFCHVIQVQDITILNFEALLDGPYQILSQFKETYRKKKATQRPSEFFLEIREKLFPILDEASDPLSLFGALAESVRTHIEGYIRDEEILFYDDLLFQMEKKLQFSDFVSKIHAKTKGVFIDEFQDTDKVQWQIFSKLFCTPKYQGAFYVVGDPKQSIYRFRAADIYTYLDAKKCFNSNQIVSLEVNYRSSSKLINGLNALFSTIEAFIPLPKLNMHLHCPPVKSGKQDLSSSFSDEKESVHFFSASTEEALFAFVVDEIKQRCTKDQISLSECAVLVKDRYQAMRFTTFCQSWHLPVVSRRAHSLADSPALLILEELLEAISHPRSFSKLGKVLSGPIFEWDHTKLKALDHAFVEQVALFCTYRDALKQHGILFFFKELMQERLPFMLEQVGGETLYLDLLRLIEILAEEGSVGESVLTTLERLKRTQSEALHMSSASSSNACQIVTIHMSKGLEYDLVFPIGLVLATMPKRELVPNNDHHQTASSTAQEEHYLELDAEKMRQFYVAATRAKKRLYLPILKKKKRSQKLGSSSAMELFLEKWNDPACSDISFSTIENDFKPDASPVEQFPTVLQPPPLISLKDNPFYLSSFTALATHKAPSEIELSMDDVLPTGKHTGILLHTLLEKLPFEGGLQSELEERIAPFVRHTPFEKHLIEISKIIHNTLHTTLPGGFSLTELDQKKVLKEMEFTIPSEKVPGFLTGFIDLICEYKGKFYLLDYKSNALPDYSQATLHSAMETNDYFLQERIYRKALQNYLALFSKKPFQDLFGGSFYLFLRGLKYQEGVFTIK